MYFNIYVSSVCSCNIVGQTKLMRNNHMLIISATDELSKRSIDHYGGHRNSRLRMNILYSVAETPLQVISMKKNMHIKCGKLLFMNSCLYPNVVWQEN